MVIGKLPRAVLSAASMLMLCLLAGCPDRSREAPPSNETEASQPAQRPIEPNPPAEMPVVPSENGESVPPAAPEGSTYVAPIEPVAPPDSTPVEPIEPPAVPAVSPPVLPGPAALPVEPAEPESESPPAQMPVSPVSSGGTDSDAKREPLFVGWEKPRLVLFITGRQYGYFEPCGCTGLENQLGGLARRDSALKLIRDKGWPVVPLDMGNQVRRFGRQAEVKFQRTIDDALKPMGYAAIAFGPDDLRLSATEVLSSVAPIEEGANTIPSRFVSANVNLFDLNEKYRVLEAAGKKIGITSVLGDLYAKKVNNDEVVITPAAEALTEILPVLEKADCDLYVLLSHCTIEESEALAKQFPLFDVVVTAGCSGEPTNIPIPIEGTDTVFIQTGIKGMYVGVVGLFDDPRQPLKYQRVPLDARFPDSPRMLDLLASYQQQLEMLGFEGLGIRPVPTPSGRTYVGSESCAECHDEDYEIWEKSGHAHALKTLEKPPERGNIPRHFDPECVSCHVVGWEPQEYIPYESGYWNLDDAERLGGVGCENCHGPGSAHVAAELGEGDVSDEETDKFREEMKLSLEKAAGQYQSAAQQRCLQCHDLDNSPAFQKEGAFESYWKKIEH